MPTCSRPTSATRSSTAEPLGTVPPVAAVQRFLRIIPDDLKRAVRHLPFADRLRTLISGRPKRVEVTPGELRPVVYPPTWLSWERMRQRPQFLLEAFRDAGHEVWFVDTDEPGQRMVEGIHVVGSLRDVPGTGAIVYSHFAPMRHVFDLFEDPVVVYDVLDDLSIYDDQEEGLPEARRVWAHHDVVVREADVVMASNEVLGARHRSERPDLIVVENGVDSTAFGLQQDRPADLPDGTVIGYHGMISTWFDFDLLIGTARRLPEFRFVLVGPTEVPERLAEATAEPNITWLGERPSDQMPAYASAFDVGAIWFEVDTMTEGVTPLKMFEYLAAGTPCVSTPLPAAVAQGSVHTAGDVEGMAAAIEAALMDDTAALKVVGQQNDWRLRIQPVLERLEQAGRLRF